MGHNIRFMSKAGKSILKGARQTLAFARGERERFAIYVPVMMDVKILRRRRGLSQRGFASRFGFALLPNFQPSGT